MTEETKRPDRSEAINELAAALAKAQGAFEPVPKSRENPRFHSRYATLDDIISATRKALSANGLAILQTTEHNEGAELLRTTLAHSSGQWMSTLMPVMLGNITNREGQAVLTQAQAYGSAISYSRRYSLAALLNVAADEDDDGNNAGEQGKPRKAESKTAQDATTGAKPPGAAPTTGAGEKAAVEGRGKCSHGVEFKLKKGTKQDGTPYEFWSAPHKVDGEWCKDRPAKVEAKTAPLPLADAPPETSNEQFDKLASASYADGGTPPLATPTQRKYILDMAGRKGQPVPANIETMTPAEANAVIEQWRVLPDAKP